MTETEARFWSKVQKTDTCWLWTGSLDRYGYGRFNPSRPEAWSAHRYAYLTLVGLIPDGQQLDHLCRVRRCVNPAHLEPVTSRENTMRGETPAAINARKTHCPKGHEYTAENTRVSADGERNCRVCHRAMNARYKARKRQEARDARV